MFSESGFPNPKVRNSLSVFVSSPLLLSGIYMYTSNDTDLLDKTTEVFSDRGTTVLSMYRDNKLISQIVGLSAVYKHQSENANTLG